LADLTNVQVLLSDYFDHLQLEARVEYPSFLLISHIFHFRGDFHLSECLEKLDYYILFEACDWDEDALSGYPDYAAND
jgi:hypothetical protein